MTSEKKDLSLEQCQMRIEDIRRRGREIVGSPEWTAEAEKLRLRVAERELDQAESAKRYRRKVARVPPTLWEALEAPEDRPAMLVAREFLAGDKLALVLSGDTFAGRPPDQEGKTFAAAWLVDQGGTGAEFLKAGELAGHGSFEPIYWRLLGERSVLAIDELGQERHDRGGWFAGAFCDLVDSRLLNGRKTVFTTNLGADDFKARYSAGDFSRLERRWKEHGRFVRLKNPHAKGTK